MATRKRRKTCKRGRRKNTKRCRRKPGPKKGKSKRKSRKRKRKYKMDKNRINLVQARENHSKKAFKFKNDFPNINKKLIFNLILMEINEKEVPREFQDDYIKDKRESYSGVGLGRHPYLQYALKSIPKNSQKYPTFEYENLQLYDLIREKYRNLVKTRQFQDKRKDLLKKRGGFPIGNKTSHGGRYLIRDYPTFINIDNPGTLGFPAPYYMFEVVQKEGFPKTEDELEQKTRKYDLEKNWSSSSDIYFSIRLTNEFMEDHQKLDESNPFYDEDELHDSNPFKFKMRSNKKEVDGIQLNNTIYTFKDSGPGSGIDLYYIVKKVEYDWNPLVNSETKEEGMFEKFGRDWYITSLQEVDSQGNLIGNPFNSGFTSSTFLKKMKVYREL